MFDPFSRVFFYFMYFLFFTSCIYSNSSKARQADRQTDRQTDREHTHERKSLTKKKKKKNLTNNPSLVINIGLQVHYSKSSNGKQWQAERVREKENTQGK